MNKSDFIKRMIGVPWINRACSFEACDCWGLVALYYRHVLSTELHDVVGYESDSDFLTCFSGEVVYWQRSELPVNDGIFVGYVGSRPEHVGLIIDGSAFHSRGANGSVAMHRLPIIERAFTSMEYFTYASN
ncbi:NlpC/P60 family protein [Candidatus Symbiopectobacterium sp. NZEC135]|uniref:NlpC/P60 family protein n=1 Tax=Candidatus Symbiopectobacterium sp. NZEC135 TaxID=2820471 RepID=UPI0022277E1F|nr:NlpC/P60 family protein [Candidatus Symbiopectobacterium sp. NZEC135]